MADLTRFFFFGCWNYDNCDSNPAYDYRKGVIDMIASKISQYQFGIIAGDNAYARDDDKYYKATIDYGFDLLRKLQPKERYYDAIGNHEIIDPAIYNHQKQQELLSISENCTMHIYNKYVRVITINTNLLSHKKRATIPPATVEQLFTDLEEHLTAEFSGWTIVVGHEPIFSVKEKEHKELKVNSLTDYKRLLDLLHLCNKVVYMCADVHEFQAWNVFHRDKTFPAVVVGTGGAPPDFPLRTKEYHFKGEDEITKASLVTSQPAYGYCEVSVSSTQIVFNYIPLQGCGDKPQPIKLVVNGKGIIKEINTKKSSESKECKAPLIDKAVCDNKDILYEKKKTLKQLSFASRPSEVGRGSPRPRSLP